MSCDNSTVIKTYREFWPFYVSQHLNPINRVLHFIGTFGALTCVGAGLLLDLRCFIAAPLFGYSFAWFGHFFFERNKPATFTYPLWSLIGDFQMFFFLISGRMKFRAD